MIHKVQSNEIYIERVYAAPIESVWDAWTDPAKVEKWWGPRGFTLTTHSKDLRAGGHWHYTMHGPDGTDYPNRTVYHEVEEHRRLVYDHGANESQPPLFRVTALFTETEEGQTKLQLTMTLSTPEAATSIRQFIKQAGGNATWDRLAEFLSETGPGPTCFVINRSFQSSPSALYDAWTTAAKLCQWLPPTGFRMECLHADIRSGGKCLSRMSNDSGVAFCVEFQYLQCNPMQITYAQRFCDQSGRTARHPALPEFPECLLHIVRFAQEEDGLTRVTLTSLPIGGFSSSELESFLAARGPMTAGWSQSFDALEALTNG